MKTWFFTETAYPYLPEEYESIRVVLPNRIFNPRVGAELYHRYIDEWVYAEEMGLDLMASLIEWCEAAERELGPAADRPTEIPKE